MTPEQEQEFEKLKDMVENINDLFLNHAHKKYDQSVPLSLPVGGYVQADGSAGILPPGWTSKKTATGQYEIAHTLGDATFVVVVSAFNSFVTFLEVDSYDNAVIDLSSFNHSGVATDSDFQFIVLPV